MPASHGRDELLSARLERFTRMLHGIERGKASAIHRTRVATRRLREVLPVLQLEGVAARKIGHALRRVTRQLGVIREIDVLLAVTDEFRKARRYPARALGVVAADIRREREGALDEFDGKVVAAEIKNVARKLERVAADLGRSDGRRLRGRAWRWAIDARAARRAADLKAAIDRAGAMYLPERLHAVRIGVKKLRYGVELGAETSGAGRRAELGALKRAQDVLGRLHDLQVLLDRVRRVQASPDPPDLATRRELDTLVVALEHACRRLHARYMRQRDTLSAICARLIVRSARQPRQAAIRRAS